MSTTEQVLGAIAPAQAAPAPAVAAPTTLKGWLQEPRFLNQLKTALPAALTPERFSRIVMTEMRRTPALSNCNVQSFLGAVLQCAQLGLEPASALGHCYLLPFGNGKAKDGKPNAQLIIGYRGMIDLARRSGQIISINAYVVHENDEFTYELGLHPDIKHVPASGERGNAIFYYAVANLKGGGVQFEVMSRHEVEEIRKQSKAGKNGPWVTHYDEMAKKTVIRRLFKYLPVSIEAAQAAEVDERSDRGEPVQYAEFVDDDDIIDVEPNE